MTHDTWLYWAPYSRSWARTRQAAAGSEAGWAPQWSRPGRSPRGKLRDIFRHPDDESDDDDDDDDDSDDDEPTLEQNQTLGFLRST